MYFPRQVRIISTTDNYDIHALVHESKTCHDCNINILYINEVFRLKDELHEQIDQYYPQYYSLCVGCTEKVLGRKLKAKDFKSDVPINLCGTISSRLAERLKDGEVEETDFNGNKIDYVPASRIVVNDYMSGVPEEYSPEYTKYLKEEKFTFPLWVSNKADEHGHGVKMTLLEMILRVPLDFWAECTYTTNYYRLNFMDSHDEYIDLTDSESLVIKYNNVFSDKNLTIKIQRSEPVRILVGKEEKEVELDWELEYQEIYDYMKDAEPSKPIDYNQPFESITTIAFKHQTLSH